MTGTVRDQVKARSHGICEARIEGVCQGRATHVHHRQMRSQGGKDTTANLAHICDRCHTHIHSEPAWSKANGWLISSWEEVA